MIAKIFVIGPGRVGKTLARIHAQAGQEVTLCGRRPGSWQVWARKNGMATQTGVSGANKPNKVGADKQSGLLFCVQDDALADAISAWQGAPVSWAAHVSGLFGPAILQKIPAKNFAAIHPVFPFPISSNRIQSLQDVFVSGEVLGSAAPAKQCVKTWGAKWLNFPTSCDRARYHAALCLASNQVMGALGLAEQILIDGGFPAQAGKSLLQSLAKQAFHHWGELGLKDAITGPLARGDVSTLKSQLNALKAKERRQYLAQLRALYLGLESSGHYSAQQKKLLKQFLQ